MSNPNTSPNAPSLTQDSGFGAASSEPVHWPRDFFPWPKPPFHIYRDEPPWLQAQACEIEGLKGVVRACFLVGLNALKKELWIQIALNKKPFPVALSQFCRVELDDPVKPLTGLDGEPIVDAIDERHYTHYRINLKTRRVLSGRTVGYVENDIGLFLFPPLNTQGHVKRVFVPKDAYTSAQFEALRQQRFEQQRMGLAVDSLRSRQANLQEPQITTPEQLLQALDNQSKLPVIRLGEVLIQLGYINDEQLHEALSFRQVNDAVPLGQILVNLGYLTRVELNAALVRKMGYPFVSLSRFPIESDALLKIPMAVAQRLMVLPLVLRANLLVVAAADPTMHGMIEELQFLTQVNVSAVLADSLEITATTSSAYQKIGSNVWGDSIDFR